jgi:hypothetical protein
VQGAKVSLRPIEDGVCGTREMSSVASSPSDVRARDASIRMHLLCLCVLEHWRRATLLFHTAVSEMLHLKPPEGIL